MYLCGFIPVTLSSGCTVTWVLDVSLLIRVHWMVLLNGTWGWWETFNQVKLK